LAVAHLNDVLGLASHLKEECGCKVLLILNDGQLSTADQATFERYLEKVVEVSVVYQPTPEENVVLGLGVQSPVADLVRKYATLLGITNIRVVKRIMRLAEVVAPIIERTEPKLVDQTVIVASEAHTCDPRETARCRAMLPCEPRFRTSKATARYTRN
jgi:hypothetical protein